VNKDAPLALLLQRHLLLPHLSDLVLVFSFKINFILHKSSTGMGARND